jgi:uncharacterized membrane protein YkvI
LRVLSYAGAIVAFLIGSGFATGKEILQYFTSYGYWGVFGTGLLVLALMTYVAVEFFTVGQAKKFERPPMIFHYSSRSITSAWACWPTSRGLATRRFRYSSSPPT